VCFSLSHSTMSMSSGSSLGSLASTGSQGSQSSVAASLSDIYIDPCQRLAYEVPEIDREALFERVERVLKCSDDHPPSCLHDAVPRTDASPELASSSSDVASSVGYLPTYEQHLERQKCRHAALPFTTQLLASTSADCWQPPRPEDDCHAQSAAFNDVIATATCSYVSVGQSDASSGVSAEGAGGSDCALAGEVRRSTSRHVSSGSATESDSGICDASVQQ